jgi:hypothetical protein
MKNRICLECNDKPLRNKWDNYLFDYNNYLKKYIKHYKRSLNGNQYSLVVYPYMKIKSEMLCKKLNEALLKNCLNEKQIKRFSKIRLKIFRNCITNSNNKNGKLPLD